MQMRGLANRRWVLTAVIAACSATSLAACAGSQGGAVAKPSASAHVTPTSTAATTSATSSSAASPSGVAAATSPAPITGHEIAAASQLGPLAKAVVRLSGQCRNPDQYSFSCVANGGPFGRTMQEVCDPFRNDVFEVARASRMNVGTLHQHVSVLSAHAALTGEQTWMFVMTCFWTRPHQVPPIIALKLGVIWQPPVIVDCSASLAGSCTQLTPRLFRVDDDETQSVRYRINGVAGGAELDLYGLTDASPAGDRGAAKLAAKLVADIDV